MIFLFIKKKKKKLSDCEKYVRNLFEDEHHYSKENFNCSDYSDIPSFAENIVE